MTFDAIIFDMDGLLVDSEPVWHQVEIDLIEAAGYRYSPELRDMGVGMRVDEFAAILQRQYPRVGDSPAAIEAALTGRMLDLPRGSIQAMPGADELLRYAAERDIPRAVASSSSQRIIDHFAAMLGWSSLIPRRFSAEFVKRGKPAPDIYLRAAAGLGLLPERCLALEDSRHGTQAALAAGMTCWTVPDPSHSSAADFADINRFVYPSLGAVLDKIKQKGLFA